MPYVLIENNTVVQKQPTPAEGFMEVDDTVTCGQVLVNGEFVNPQPAPPSIQTQIIELEAQQTPRRIREASLTPEGAAWLSGLDAQIAALRAQLPVED